MRFKRDHVPNPPSPRSRSLKKEHIAEQDGRAWDWGWIGVAVLGMGVAAVATAQDLGML
jgi:hypothetical protein